jgi:formylglycine-generating enzyme required for sulfatase activity
VLLATAPALPEATFRDCATCPLMVVVPSGRFEMGSSAAASDELGSSRDETPVRTVEIRLGFAVSKYEVTVAQYREFARATRRKAAGGCRLWSAGILENRASGGWRSPGFPQRADEPVTCVTWHDAQDYVAWLRSRTGLGYRLLTEAEWEYAARGGARSVYSFGDDVGRICEFANVPDLDAARALGNDPPAGCRDSHRDAIACRSTKIAALSERFDVRAPTMSVTWEVVRCRDGFGDRTAPVGTFAPNGYGLHDTTGNVWEWVQDCYGESYEAAPRDGSAVEAGACRLRVLRGGAWAMNTDGWRVADRDRDDPDARYAVVGFRVARSDE